LETFYHELKKGDSYNDNESGLMRCETIDKQGVIFYNIDD